MERTGLSLVCRVRGSFCALPLADVVETARLLPVEPLAAAPDFVRGLSIIRGAAVPVIDASVLITGQPSEARRLVVIAAGGRKIALAVDEIVGVRTIPPDRFGDLPPLLRNARRSVVETIGTLDAELFMLLNTARILPDEFFEAIEATRRAS